MVQLTLPGSGRGCGLQDTIAILSRDWARSLGGGAHVSAAVRATDARFAEWGGRDLSQGERRRVAAYFSAVVRRTVVRSRDFDAREARRRLLALSIEADLRNAGWDAGRASSEAARITQGRPGYQGAA